jgi:type II secretory pathway pseudopilin PulG
MDGAMIGRDQGMTLIALLVVVFIISVLVGALMPGFSRVQSKARDVMCVSNMHQVLLGLQMYVNDYGELPLDHAGQVVVDGKELNPGIQWTTAALPYIRDKEVFLCPQDPTRGTGVFVRGIPCSWGYGYTTAIVEASHAAGKEVASESPVLTCLWHVRTSDVIVIGRKDASIEVAPRLKYSWISTVFE